MPQVTLNIPDSKFTFFMELVKNLGFTKSNEIEIPEDHKQIVRQRIEASNKNPNLLLDWDDVEKSFKLD